MRVKKLAWTKGLDFPDLLIEDSINYKEVTLDEFNNAVSSEVYQGKKVIKAIETENFGYFVTEDKQVYRC